ncbi:SpvB/TcaC N-terminal domain-containing protein [Marinicella sp. W31]|uniref:SpvB/TcaC N-terminal domain-containing protein n=1 Tax=Marinicella sp. W31 TaxID=3023713 RepID=UPI00375730D2
MMKFLQSAFYVLLLSLLSSTSLKAKTGFTENRLYSSDGRFELAFKREKGTSYRIISHSEMGAQVHQTFGEDRVSFYRPKTGVYQYSLQNCADPNPNLRCLSIGKPIEVTVDLSQKNSRNTCGSSSDCGGVDQLQPGQWWNPSKEGHGWDVYWVNDLNSNNSSSNPYELYVLWYTYRLDQNSVNELVSQWIPTWLLGKLQESNGTYSGDLHYCHEVGGKIECENSVSDAGDLTVTFSTDNTQATFNWALDTVKFPGFPASGTDSVEFFGNSLPSTQPGLYAFFNGIWNNRIDPNTLNPVFNYSEFMRENYWSAVFSFFDKSGLPVWVKSELNSDNVSPALRTGGTEYIRQGYSPAWNKPLWYDTNDYKISSGNFMREFTTTNDGNIYANINLPNYRKGGLSIGSYFNRMPLERQTGISAIWFDVNGDPTATQCSTYVHGNCALNLGWSLDHGITASVHDHQSRSVQLVTDTTETTQNFSYSPSVGSTPHRFTLNTGAGIGGTLLGETQEIVVSNDVISPSLVSFTVTEGTGKKGSASPGQFDINWNWTGIGSTRFELEYRYGSKNNWVPVETFTVFQIESAASTINTPTQNKDYHNYRLKACNASECTSWNEITGLTLSTTSLSIGAVLDTHVPDASLSMCVRNGGFPDTDPIENITFLYCDSYSDIQTLDGLEYFTNLESLVIWNLNLTDISALQCRTNQGTTCFPHLQEVGFYFSQLGTKLNSLSGLTSLRWLDLHGSSFSDLSSLATLPILELVAAPGAQIGSLGTLGDSNSLKQLILDNTNVFDISTLANTQTLEILQIENTPVNDLSFLSSLPALRVLNYSAENTADLTSISNINSLVSVSLPDNDHRQHDYLNALTNLRRLVLGPHVENLDFLTNRPMERVTVTGDFAGQSAFNALQNVAMRNVQYLNIAGTAENVDLTPLITLINTHNAPANLNFNFKVTGLRCDQQLNLLTALNNQGITGYSYDPTTCISNGNGLQAVIEQRFVWVDESEGTFKLQWGYPSDDFNSVTGRPDFFRVFPGISPNNGGSLNTVPVEPEDAWQETWETSIALDKDNVFGSVFDIVACHDTNPGVSCGPKATVQLVATGVDYMPVPRWDLNRSVAEPQPPMDCPYSETAQHSWTSGGNAGIPLLDLSTTPCSGVTNLNNTVREKFFIKWEDLQAFHSDVDYYEIEEYRFAYRETSAVASGVITYYSDKPYMDIVRSKEFMYRFRVRSCNRIRGEAQQDEDVCSEFSKGVVYNLFVPGFRMNGEPIVNWFTDSEGNRQLQLSVPESVYTNEATSPDYFFVNGAGGQFDSKIFINNWQSTGWQTTGASLPDGEYDVVYCQNTGLSPHISNFAAQRSQVDYCSQIETIQLPNVTREVAAPKKVVKRVGGPSDLRPGEWWDPEKSGTGWSFYWASDLRYPSTHEQYGDTYDLIAMWFAYRKLPGDDSWRPVWYYSQMKFEGGDSGGNREYFGNLLYPQANGEHVEVGSLRINFPVNPDNEVVDLIVEMIDSGGMYIDETYQLKYFAQSENFDNLCNVENTIDHFNGMWWQAGAELFPDLGEINTPFVMTNWITSDYESLNIAMFDDNGYPAWVRGEKSPSGCIQPPGLNETLNMYSVIQGFDPNEPTPSDFFDGGVINTENYKQAGTLTRSYQLGDYRSGNITANIDLSDAYCEQGGTCIRDGLLNVDTSLNKTANFHDIRFFVDNHLESTDNVDNCSLSQEAENDFRCELKFTWFTDGYYTDKRIAYRYQGQTISTDFQTLCSNNSAGYTAGPVDGGPFVEQEYRCDLMDNAPGSYQFFLQKHNLNNSVDYSTMAESVILNVSTEILSSNSADTPPDPVTIADVPTEEGDPGVGSMAGQFNVNGSGQATYTVPIFTNAGTGGLTPSVTLNYNSSGGNSPLGMGWSIGGPSMITRCPKTIIHDGLTSPVAMDDSVDRLCMDGQRLLKVSAPGNYFEATAEYRTEIDRYIKVTWADDGNGRYLKAELPDGSISTYGRDTTLGSRIRANPNDTVYAWAQDTFIDSKGNYINFEYQDFSSTDEIEFHLRKVKYTGHDRDRNFTTAQSEDHTPFAEIEFIYQGPERVDTYTKYLAGIAFKQTRRLGSIVSRDSGAELREYRLTYNLDGVGRSMLSQITECASTHLSATCFSPTVFDWNRTATQIDPTVTDAELTVQLPQFNIDGIRTLRVVDFDGNGRQDIVYADTVLANDNLDTVFGAVLSEVEGDAFAGFGNEFLTIFDGQSIETGGKWAVIDYDANGYQDIIYSLNARFHIIRWEYDSVSGENTAVKINDVGILPTPGNADARFYTASKIEVMDVNADGYPDLVYIGFRGLAAQGYYVSYHNRFADNLPIFADPIAIAEPDVTVAGYNRLENPPSAQGLKRVRTIELNGDAASDLLSKYTSYYCPIGQSCDQNPFPKCGEDNVICHSAWYLHEADPNNVAVAFKDPEIIAYDASCNATLCTDTAVPVITNEAITLVDVNADGLSDLMLQTDSTNGTWQYQLNVGFGVFGQAVTLNNINKGEYARFVDIDGNGYLDLLYPSECNKCDLDMRPWMIRYYRHGTYEPAVTSTFRAGDVEAKRDDNTFGDQDTSIFMDANGDGMTDHLFIDRTPSTDTTPPNTETTLILGTNQLDPYIGYEAENVIEKITDGLGAEIQIKYQSMVQRSVYTRTTAASQIDYCDDGLPFSATQNCEKTAVYDFIAPAYLVNEVATSAPGRNAIFNENSATIGLSGYGGLNISQHYYAGAKVQTGGRGSLGFEYVSTYNPHNGLQSTRRLSQTFPTIGRVIETQQERLLGGTIPFPPSLANLPAQDEVINPCLDGTGIDCEPPDPICPPDVTCGSQRIASRNSSDRIILSAGENSWTFKNASGGNGLSFVPYLSSSVQYTFNPDTETAERLSTIESQVTNVDGFGNPRIVQTTYKRPNPNNPNDEQTIFTQLVDNGFTNLDSNGFWQIGLLRSSEVQSIRTLESGCITECDKTRKIWFDYDGDGILFRETLELGAGPQLSLINQYGLDAYGNRTSVVVRNAGTEIYRRADIEFDAAYHRYVDKQINAYGQVISEVIERDQYGNPTLVDDLLKNRSTLTYDDMGRSRSRYHESGVWSHVAYYDQSFAPNADCPAGTSAYIVGQSAGTAASTTCLDVLGRAQRTVSTGFNGELVYQDVEYDVLGRTVEATEPYYSTETAAKNQSVYDVYSRAIYNLNADQALTSYSYDGLTARTVSPRLHQGQSIKRTEYRNILGELIRVTDNDKNDPTHPVQADTTYVYNAVGELTSVTGPSGIPQTVTYNTRGHKTFMNDPDMGLWTYEYDALGQLKTQQTTNGSVIERIEFDYDQLGRITQRQDYQGTSLVAQSDWTFNNCDFDDTGCQHPTSSIGQLVSEQMVDGANTSVNLFARGYQHDNFGRSTRIQTDIRRSLAHNPESYLQSFTYDQYSRSFQSFEAAGEPGQFYGLRYQYNSYGFLSQLRDSAKTIDHPNGRIYATISDLNPRGQLRSMTLGNQTTTTQIFDVLGRVTDIDTASNLGTSGIQNLEYEYDILGNLTHREDLNSQQYEDFFYDAHNRLIRTDLGQFGNPVETSESFNYHKNGNMTCRKSDNSCDSGNTNYIYGSNKPHAVTQAILTNGVTSTLGFTYDDKGNQLTKSVNGAPKRSVAYSVFNKPTSVQEDNEQTIFFYDSNRSRYYRKDLVDQQTTKETLYIGNVEVITEDDSTQFRRNVAGVAIVTLLENGDEIVGYTHRDHHGSVDKITDENGYVVDEYSFDAFGGRRDPSDWSITNYQPSPAQLDVTNYGYTDHEHIESAGIIHMNGRIYDPQIGRMMQADPFVQLPGLGQSYNRYSYVLNNPLTFTDPTGYMCEGAVSDSNCDDSISIGIGGSPVNDPFIRNGSDIVIAEEGRARAAFAQGFLTQAASGRQQVDQTSIPGVEVTISDGLFGSKTITTFTPKYPGEKRKPCNLGGRICGYDAGEVNVTYEVISIRTSYLKYLSQYSENFDANTRRAFGPLSRAADRAADYYAARVASGEGGILDVIGGVLASTLTEGNAGNTVITLSTGGLGGSGRSLTLGRSGTTARSTSAPITNGSSIGRTSTAPTYNGLTSLIEGGKQ